MQKIAKKLSIIMVALFTVFTVLSYVPVKAAVTAPKVGYVEAPKLEYTVGDRVSFNLNAPNYGGRVQYRVVLWNDETKSYRDLWLTGDRYYTNWMPYGNETFTLGWPIFEPGHYRITIYAKRAGIPNSQTALKGMNCDSYMNSEAFIVKAKVQEATAADKVANYENAPLTTVEEITAAEAIRTEAVALIANLTDATEKAALTARVDAQDKKVAEAKYVTTKEITAIDANTIKLVFNKDVAVNTTNVKIYEKGNSFNSILVNTVTVDKTTATLKTFNPLLADKTYILEISNVKSVDGKFAMKATESKEVTFKKATPVSIAITSNRVKVGEKLTYVIKDAAGNDISANYTLGTDIIAQSTSTDVINYSLSALKAGYSVVNLLIKDTSIQTGNTTVTAYELSGSMLANLGRFSLGNLNFNNPTTSVTLSSTLTPVKMNIELLDQYNVAFNGVVDYNYQSSNPMVALVNATDGMVTPLSVGTTAITVFATQMSIDGKTVIARTSKTFAITVKEEPKAAKLAIDKTYVKVVKGSNITEKIHVNVLDQYGNIFKPATSVTLTADKSDIVIFNPSYNLVNGEQDVILSAGATNGTAVFVVEYSGLAKVSFVVENINPGSFAGYISEVGATTLDVIPLGTENYNTLKKGPSFTAVDVFEKDASGNKITKLSMGSYTLESLQTDVSKRILDLGVPGQVNSIPGKTGTETIAVKINNLTIQTYTFTVVNSAPVLATVSQLKTAVGVYTGDMSTSLIGTYNYVTKRYDTKGVFVGFDQYGNEVPIVIESIVSTDTSVVSSSGYAIKAGNVTLVIKIANKLYQLDVVVR